MSADACILAFDRALRTLTGTSHGARVSPAASLDDPALDDADRREAAALMRVNHAGEVCAQALYQGQALGARDARVAASLAQAAREEEDHLAWSEARIAELNGRRSVLNPLWYAGSFAIGVAAARMGDRWNLGFLAETEGQVAAHLEGHLARLPEADLRTRAVVEAMRNDEAGHRRTALGLGAEELPGPVRLAMRLAARVMTTISQRI
jgi:ubiquinone biosynthesis monooxygenase Coq7